VGWRWCAKIMDDLNVFLDTRLPSPRTPASIAAVVLEGIFSETFSASSQKRRTWKTPERRTLKNRVPTGKMRMYHPPLNSTKSKVIKVTWYNLTLDLHL